MANLTGVVGEHYAAAELTRRGFLVTLTRGNAPGVDLLAYHPATQKTVAIQVKTALGSKQKRGQWIMNQKDEDQESLRSHVFIFVYLPKELDQSPEYTIVPSVTVAQTIFKDHQAWQGSLGAKGQQHNTTPMRQFKDPLGEHLDKWQVILNFAGIITRVSPLLMEREAWRPSI